MRRVKEDVHIKLITTADASFSGVEGLVAKNVNTTVKCLSMSQSHFMHNLLPQHVQSCVSVYMYLHCHMKMSMLTFEIYV